MQSPMSICIVLASLFILPVQGWFVNDHQSPSLKSATHSNRASGSKDHTAHEVKLKNGKTKKRVMRSEKVAREIRERQAAQESVEMDPEGDVLAELDVEEKSASLAQMVKEAISLGISNHQLEAELEKLSDDKTGLARWIASEKEKVLLQTQAHVDDETVDEELDSEEEQLDSEDEEDLEDDDSASAASEAAHLKTQDSDECSDGETDQHSCEWYYKEGPGYSPEITYCTMAKNGLDGRSSTDNNRRDDAAANCRLTCGICTPTKKCALGLTFRDSVCCPKTCGKCGGVARGGFPVCEERPGGEAACCFFHIRQNAPQCVASEPHRMPCNMKKKRRRGGKR